MKKKLIIVNPHINNGFFCKSLYNTITNRKDYKKYQYLFDGIKNEKFVELSFYFDGRDSSMPFRFSLYVEVALWYLINLLNPFKNKPIFNIRKKSADTVFLFAHRNLDKESGAELVNEIKEISDSCIVHMTHFHADIKNTSANIKLLEPKILCAESNLASCSGLFRKHFFFYNSSFLVLPFCPQDRFKNIKINFNKRIKKAMATGTLHKYGDSSRTEEFCSFYNTNTLHPIRKEIFDNKENFTDQIDSYIYEWLDVAKIDTTKKSINLLQRIYGKYSNHFLSKANNYFKFDMVQTFNSYQMFIAPSEKTGLPSVGMTEGMMCGAAYIGTNDISNAELGLIDKHNFISYDGSKEDLIEKIKYYQDNPNHLETIAKNGHEYAKKEFDRKIVSKKFIDAILNL